MRRAVSEASAPGACCPRHPAALAWYWNNRVEVQCQIQEDLDLVAGMKQQIPSKLVNRLVAQDDADAAISLR